MSDLQDLDRLFDDLAREAARAHRPGAAAAVRTARTRRRRTLTGVAAVAALSVGVAVAPPSLTERVPGLAANAPDPAPFDAAALTGATKGWIEGWDDDLDPSGDFTKPDCETTLAGEAQRNATGLTRVVADDSTAVLQLATFADEQARDSAWSTTLASLAECDDFRGTDPGLRLPDGTDLRHWTVTYGPDAAPGGRLTDLWVARAGSRLAMLQVTSPEGPAPDEAVTAVGEAVVAGVLDGWTETGEVPVEPEPPMRGLLPEWDDRALTEALGGWRSADRLRGEDLPLHPCLSWPKTLPTRGAGRTTGMPTGTYLTQTGWLEPGPEAAALVERTIEGLEACGSVEVTRRELDGVTLLTYDLGGLAGHGAAWLAADDERALVVAQDGAADPMPEEVGPRVAAWLRDTLDQPWAPAS